MGERLNDNNGAEDDERPHANNDDGLQRKCSRATERPHEKGKLVDDNVGAPDQPRHCANYGKAV